MLTISELQRYARHLPVIGQEGQSLLKQAKVACIGAGGLGSPALQYLAAAGVGSLAVIDHDRVETSNLQRQILFTEDDIGQWKAVCAKQRLAKLNPCIEIHAYTERLSSENARELLADYDIVVDGSDNFPTRYLLNDFCRLLKKPLVTASVFQFQGQISVFDAQHGPCYRCLYNSPPPSPMPDCAAAGVLGVLPGILGSLQALEVIKWITRRGQSLAGRLLTFDALTLRFQEFSIARDPDCPLCQRGELSSSLFDKVAPSCNQVVREISPQQLSAWLQNQDAPIVTLLDVRESHERALGHIGGQHWPLSDFDPSQLPIEKNACIVVYCKLGGRSQSAAHLLQQNGFQDVYSLQGGITAWQQQIAKALP